MKIQTFKNLRGLIYGNDPKRIGCDKEGVLKIGSTEVTVSPEKEEIMPLLFHGCSGEYAATFTENEKYFTTEIPPYIYCGRRNERVLFERKFTKRNI